MDIYKALYVGSGAFLTAAQAAGKVGISENEARAELAELIAAKKVVQLVKDGKYVFAHRAAIA